MINVHHKLSLMEQKAVRQDISIYRAPVTIITADGEKIRSAIIKYSITQMDKEAKMHKLLAENPVTAPFVPRLFSYKAVNIQEKGRDAKTPFKECIVMEDFSQEYQPLSEFKEQKLFLPLLAEVTKIMFAMHSINIAHNDLDISNLLFRITDDNRLDVKVIDFGRTGRIGSSSNTHKNWITKGLVHKVDLDFNTLANTFIRVLRNLQWIKGFNLPATYHTFDGQSINIEDFLAKLRKDYRLEKSPGYAQWIQDTVSLLLYSLNGPYEDLMKSA